MRTGYRIALAIAAVTVVLGSVLLVIEALGTTRDATAYGQISVPGRDSITLPEGEVIVYYGERGLEKGTPLTIPDDLRLRVQTTGGATLGSTPSGFNEFQDGDYVRRSVGFLKVPEAGPYEAISPTVTARGDDPVISFGRNGSRNIGYALFVLAGGLLLAGILAAGTWLTARLERES